jgi:hypothetical protein
MSYAPGAPDQIWALAGLDAGAKLTLLRLWSWADHEVQRSPVETTVWAAGRLREDGSKMGAAEALQLTLAEGTGQTARAVRSHLTRLRAEGLADADGRCVRLTPPRQACRSSVDTKPSAADTTVATPDVSPSATDTKPSGNYTPQYPANTQPEHTTAGEPAPVEGHPCTVLDSPEVTPASIGHHDAKPDNPSPSVGSPSNSGSYSPPEAETADSMRAGSSQLPSPNGHAKPPDTRPSPTTSRARKRKAPPAPKPGQTALDIGEAPEADVVGQLLADHERLRQAAQRAHGLRETPLPSPTSGDGRSLRLRLRKAVGAHGPDACRRALEYRAAEWVEDPGALSRWSTDSMWSPKSLAVSLGASTNGKRAGPTRGLPVERDAPDRTYHWQDDPIP